MMYLVVITFSLVFVVLNVVEAKSLTMSVSPSCAMPAISLLSNVPNANLTNNSSRRDKSVFVSPGTSPTRYGNSYISRSSGHSPVDAVTPAAFPVDSAEAGRRSRTLPPHADRLLADNSSAGRAAGTTDGPGDMTAYSVAPKPLSREELPNTDLDIGSVVEFDIGSERHYGVIRWIGYVSNKQHVIVGIELVNTC